MTIGSDKTSLDTPALMVDLDILQENIGRIAEACRVAGVHWRPHTKGSKVPALAHKFLAAGAIGVTCAKLGEAEVMAAAGITDILIANQIVGAPKLARLMGLCRHADPIVAVDHPDQVAALDQAALATGVRPRVLIEVDIGMRRGGVLPGQPVLSLARLIARHGHVRFAGLMGWEAHTVTIADPAAKEAAVAAAVAEITGSADLCREAGLPIDIVSCGGTGTYWLSSRQPGVTEIQAGGGVFGDVHYRTHYGVPHRYALTMLTTVTSRPNGQRIVCDAGKKAMSGDSALPLPIGLDHVKSVRLSAEHVTVELERPDERLRIGDKLEFVVGYSDTTVLLHETLHGVRDGKVEIAWPILGRGRLQ